MITALPRPVLMLLVGVVAVAGVFLLSHRGTNSADTSAPSAPSSAPATSTPAPSSAAPSTADKAAPPAQSAPRSDASSGAGLKADQPRTLPRPVSRALDAHKVVVLLFWNPRAVDDRSVRKAVAGVSRRGGKVAVFTDRLKHLARYTKITAAANVVQTPTLIVVDRKGQAQMATGYMDSVSVDQHVVDALHGS